MPTTEERLAALEKQMAAWMDQRPTTYYTHQYSGEEIDAAVGRALTGGALDTSVTNVSNQLGTFVRPNLLDNWYFGNPVDQRGGKIIQSGVNIYTDSAMKTLIGPAAYACPVVELTSTYAKVQDAKNTGSYYYAAPADVVRGYTGNGYTVDRWVIDIISGGAVLVGSSGITLTSQGMYWGERLSNIADLSGKTMTASVLMSDGSLFCGTVVIAWTLNVPQSFFNNSLIRVYANKIGDDLAQFEIASNAANVSILAAKLELGPTQTLAHQENGAWVLNEVPDYGEQLRRCQRYYQKFDENVTLFYGNSGSSGGAGARLFLPTAVQMRTKPVTSPFVINVLPEGTIAGTNNITFTPSDVAVVPGGVCLYGAVSSSVSIGSYTYKAIVAQLRNAPLALSADL